MHAQRQLRSIDASLLCAALFALTAAACGAGGEDEPFDPGRDPANLVADQVTIGETTVLGSADSGNANYLIASRAELGQPGTIESMSFYARKAAGKLLLAVYDATGPGGGPGAKVAETGEITLSASGWRVAAVTQPVTLTAGTYWLAFLPSSSRLVAADAPSGSTVYYAHAFGPMPATFSSSPASITEHFSLYATLTLATGGGTAPTVAIPAAANPGSTTGTTTALTVLGADDGGEPGLTYTWAAVGAPPAPVSFAVNGTNAAKSTVATFAAAGSYTLRATIADATGLTATSDVTVTVTPTGEGPSLGAHVLGRASLLLPVETLTTDAVTTRPGSLLLVAAGKGYLALLETPTDSKQNAYHPLGSRHHYRKWSEAGTALFEVEGAAGGADHTFSGVAGGDELTLLGVEVAGGRVVQDLESAYVSGSTTFSSPSVTTTGPATLVAFCFPESGGPSTVKSVSDGFTLLDQHDAADQNSVQAASAGRTVTAAGTYSVTFTMAEEHDGAIVYIVAVQ